MQKLILTLLIIIGIGTTYAQTPSSILAQLGSRGVTSIGGTTNYNRYLILLDADGKINSAMLPSTGSSTGVAGQTLTDLYFIDKNGMDSTNSGSVGKPYATFNYALSQITNDAVFVFSPGVHASAATPISTASINHLTLIGFNPLTTRIDDAGLYSLAFQNSAASRVDITGITVDKISQLNNVTTVVNAYNGGVLGTMARSYASYTNSYATLYMDPSSSVPTLSTNSITVYSHGANNLAYHPSNTVDWSVQPSTVQEGIDYLASKTVILAGDVVGSYDSNTVVALQGISLDTPEDTNDLFAIIYDYGNNKFTYKEFGEGNGATNIIAGSSNYYDMATRTLMFNTNLSGGGSSGVTGTIENITSDGSIDILNPEGPSVWLSVSNFVAGELFDLGTNIAYIDSRVSILEPNVAYIDSRVGILEPNVAYIDSRVSILEPNVAYIDSRVGILETNILNTTNSIEVGSTAITNIYTTVNYKETLVNTNYAINMMPAGNSWTNIGGLVQPIVLTSDTNRFTYGVKSAAGWVTNNYDLYWSVQLDSEGLRGDKGEKGDDGTSETWSEYPASQIVTNTHGLAMNNNTFNNAGNLEGTNGVYWSYNGTNYWILFE